MGAKSAGQAKESVGRDRWARRSVFLFLSLAQKKYGHIGRWCLEILFYFVILAVTFPNMTPLKDLRGGLGGLVDLVGMLFLGGVLISERRLPFSLAIALFLNIPVNLTEHAQGNLSFVGSEAAGYLHWFFYLAMMLFLTRNEKTARRITLFFAAVIVLSVIIGGHALQNDFGRLGLRRNVGVGFQNSNDLAHMSAMFAVACMFWSLSSSKIMRPVYWICSAILVGVLLRTVSRGGLLGLTFGLAILLALILSGKSVRLSGFVLILAVVAALFLWQDFLQEKYELFSKRATLQTGREKVYNVYMLDQAKENLLLGSGGGTIVRNARTTAHNTFLYHWICYGGIAAMIYLVWLFVLSRRVWLAFCYREIAVDKRFMLVALWGMALVAQLVSNQAHLFYSSIFATALIEKYTFPYTRRNLKKRLRRAENDSLKRRSRHGRSNRWDQWAPRNLHSSHAPPIPGRNLIQ
jgi:hypothetical protein